MAERRKTGLIALYEAERHPLEPTKPLAPEAAAAEARVHYAQWYPKLKPRSLRFDFSGKKATRTHGEPRPRSRSTKLQSASTTVSCWCPLYSPKSHKLNCLRSQAEDMAPDPIALWPRDTRFARRCFELLRQAYVNARYSKHYRITAEELAWLGERIDVLASEVQRICEARIEPGAL